ncbi:hypothetical protein T492DRAFT_1012830 [Pavlovales sp. CCMP2436]|nr:hypothetical protein T492DRAFT_1012830 [Pavlovales sp. CCMP2436]
MSQSDSFTFCQRRQVFCGLRNGKKNGWNGLVRWSEQVICGLKTAKNGWNGLVRLAARC